MKARKKVKLKHVESEKDLSITVRRIADRWHARLFNQNGDIIDEMACSLREDITYICRVMLRCYDKSEMQFSKFASASRARHNRCPAKSHGEVWYAHKLKLREKRDTKWMIDKTGKLLIV